MQRQKTLLALYICLNFCQRKFRLEALEEFSKYTLIVYYNVVYNDFRMYLLIKFHNYTQPIVRRLSNANAPTYNSFCLTL